MWVSLKAAGGWAQGTTFFIFLSLNIKAARQIVTCICAMYTQSAVVVGGGGHGKTHGAVISSWNEFAPKLQACPGHRAPRALGTPCFFRFSQPPATTSLHHMVCRLCTCPVACGLSDSGNDVFFLPFHHPHHMCPTSWWDGATKHSAFHHHHFVKELS